MTPLNPQFTSDTYNPHHQSIAAVPIDQPAPERCDENDSQKQQSPQMRQKASSASNNPLWLGGGHALGAWTQLHWEASIDPKKIPALIASGAPIDAQTDDGLTLLKYFIIKKDANALAQLLAAGANPLLVPKQEPCSPLVYALTQQPELAMALAEALPMGATGNFFAGGFSEVHFATTLPAVLYVMLSRGMRDSITDTGITALMLAVKNGELHAVKYLLGQRPRRESDSEFEKYLNNSEKAAGWSALSMACHRDRFEIAELLIRHGATLKNPLDEQAFFEFACEEKNFDLLKFLLKNSSATSRPQLADLLQRSLRLSWTEGVAELAAVVNLSTTDQIKLLNTWKNHPKAELLTAIAPAVGDAACSMAVLLKRPKLLDALVKHNDLDLLSAVLQFFERRKSFGFIIQSAISYMLDDDDPVFDDSQGKLLLEFVLKSQQLGALVSHPDTAMRLLQLSDRLKNYVLVTEIKGNHFPGSRFEENKIPFQPEWISDPIAVELLELKNSQSRTPLSSLVRTVTSYVYATDHVHTVDGAQLSNDLIFAVRADKDGAALDKVLDAHQVSAIIQQAVKPVLFGLMTQLYPDPAIRPEAICRFVIAYTFSTLKDNPRFNQHPAFEMMQSDPRWASMKQQVAAEIEALEQVGATIINTVVSVQLWQTLPDKAVELALESLSAANPVQFLTAAFRSLGALDVLADRLAQACINSVRNLQAQVSSRITSGKTSAYMQMQLKTLITQELEAIRQLPKLAEQLITSVSSIQGDLVPEFHDMFWWQRDLIYRAFGIKTEQDAAPGSLSLDKQGSSATPPSEDSESDA